MRGRVQPPGGRGPGADAAESPLRGGRFSLGIPRGRGRHVAGQRPGHQIHPRGAAGHRSAGGVGQRRQAGRGHGPAGRGLLLRRLHIRGGARAAGHPAHGVRGLPLRRGRGHRHRALQRHHRGGRVLPHRPVLAAGLGREDRRGVGAVPGHRPGRGLRGLQDHPPAAAVADLPLCAVQLLLRAHGRGVRAVSRGHAPGLRAGHVLVRLLGRAGVPRLGHGRRRGELPLVRVRGLPVRRRARGVQGHGRGHGRPRGAGRHREE
mmetsp:Transcript_19414/g.57739  ORF Transcript_19414/g.57739 Transcript_19414/m.57739 type:complete len:262 (-) Transcript_19414:27-812(-)